MKYFYHDRNGELHGPAELDFLACEVKWGGLPDHLIIRPVDGEELVLLSEIMEDGIRLFRTRFPAGRPVRFPVHDAGGLPGAGGCPDSAGACSSSPDAGNRRVFLFVLHLPALESVAGVANCPSILCLVLEKAS